MSERLQRVLDRIDELNAGDPNRVIHDGEEISKEILYSRRMSECLFSFQQDPPEVLQIAVRAQHIQRWKISRQDYPAGREGYNEWRKDQARHHSEVTAGLMAEEGYGEEEIQQVRDLLMKKNLKSDALVQSLEDVACLVFLEHYFEDFSGSLEEEKVISIVKKTWAKMSDAGHQAALQIDFPDGCKGLVTKALG